MIKRIEPKEGQESVWDYPRPPRLEKTKEKHIEIFYKNEKIVDSKNALRMLETSHPPTYYIPKEDIKMDYFKSDTDLNTNCEWKGRASYFHLHHKNDKIENVAWCYPEPVKEYNQLKNHVAFYARYFDCFVNGEKVTPQEGQFYGGWITSDLAGPFKGGPGTMFW